MKFINFFLLQFKYFKLTLFCSVLILTSSYIITIDKSTKFSSSVRLFINESNLINNNLKNYLMSNSNLLQMNFLESNYHQVNFIKYTLFSRKYYNFYKSNCDYPYDFDKYKASLIFLNERKSNFIQIKMLSNIKENLKTNLNCNVNLLPKYIALNVQRDIEEALENVKLAINEYSQVEIMKKLYQTRSDLDSYKLLSSLVVNNIYIEIDAASNPVEEGVDHRTFFIILFAGLYLIYLFILLFLDDYWSNLNER